MEQQQVHKKLTRSWKHKLQENRSANWKPTTETHNWIIQTKKASMQKLRGAEGIVLQQTRHQRSKARITEISLISAKQNTRPRAVSLLLANPWGRTLRRQPKLVVVSIRASYSKPRAASSAGESRPHAHLFCVFPHGFSRKWERARSLAKYKCAN